MTRILGLRELYRYQTSCRAMRTEDFGIHARIMESVQRTHAEMEACLADVLAAEGWDMTTLTMPEGLRKLRDSCWRSSGGGFRAAENILCTTKSACKSFVAVQ